MMKTGLKKGLRQPGTRPASRYQRKRPTNAGQVDSRQGQMMRDIDNSPAMMLQRKQLERSFGHPVQRVAEDEELLQGKFDTLQRQGAEEEELLQGKFDTLQRQGPEEEELLQGKFDTLQRQGPEDEELLQGKFDTLQRQGPEDEEEDEELLQGKFDTLQRQGPEDEELLQGKFPQPLQREQENTAAANNTGIPDSLKNGIESLSGMDVSEVRVHYNSSRPAQLNALAYAQGNQIHLGSGQEKHLAHETWHTVQQRMGRVQPTMRMGGEQINDDAGLEHEADVMGEKALRFNK